MLDRALEDALPYLFALLGIAEGDDPWRRWTRNTASPQLEAIKRILLRESLNQPLIVIFEDLHWIDGETQALLNCWSIQIGTARVLLLVNYRPEYQHRMGQQEPTTPSSGSTRSVMRARNEMLSAWSARSRLTAQAAHH